MQVVAVNSAAYRADRLKRAITAAKTSTAGIELLLRQGDVYRSVRIDYRAGLRYPHLERIAGAADRLSQVMAARK